MKYGSRLTTKKVRKQLTIQVMLYHSVTKTNSPNQYVTEGPYKVCIFLFTALYLLHTV